MANDRNAGRKHKFSKGGQMKPYTFTRSLPVKGKETITKAIDEAINQFKDYDWT